MKGKIMGVNDHGTIVEVLCEGEDGRFPIYFGHRMFAHLCEDLDGGLVGAVVDYDGKQVYREPKDR